MKRITTLVLLAGFAGGCATTDANKTVSGGKPFNTASKGKEVPGLVGPTGEPVVSAAAPGPKKAMPNGKTEGGVMQASATTGMIDPNVSQTAGFTRIIGGGMSGGCNTGNCGDTGAHTPGVFNHQHGGHGGYANSGGHGIIPAPPMGPAGAVAAIGAIGPGFGMPVASNMRTSIKFLAPQGARVTWLAQGSYAEPGLVAPAEYNFHQGNIYRLKVSGIANRPGKTYYPTLEVAAATLKTLTFLDHGTVPVSFSDEDLQRVDSGNLVIKVIYLPDSLYQDVTAAGAAEEIISTQLEPGTDPVVEANRRGTILAIIRIGNINLENPASPAKDAPPSNMGMPAGPQMMPAAPPQAMPIGKVTTPSGIVPVSMMK